MINRHMTSFQCIDLMVVIKIPDKSNLRKKRFIMAYICKDLFHPHWQERYCCKSRRCGSQSKKPSGHIGAAVRRIQVLGPKYVASYIKWPTFSGSARQSGIMVVDFEGLLDSSQQFNERFLLSATALFIR